MKLHIVKVGYLVGNQYYKLLVTVIKLLLSVLKLLLENKVCQNIYKWDLVLKSSSRENNGEN